MQESILLLFCEIEELGSEGWRRECEKLKSSSENDSMRIMIVSFAMGNNLRIRSTM